MMTLAYWFGHTLFKTLARGLFNYQVIGRERLNLESGALLVCNHASFVDPPLVGVAFDEEIYYLARKTLMSNSIARKIYKAWNTIPVDQERPDMTSLKTVIKLLKQGEKVLIFPEGTRSEDGKLKKGQPGVGLIVAKAGVPVIPMRLFGTNEAMPVGSSAFHPAEVTLVVGEPWYYDPQKYADSGKDLYASISDDLMAEIAKIQL